MSASIEIELTFLAKYIPPEVLSTTPQQLVDIYIPEQVDFPRLRLRQADNNYEMTKKTLVENDDFSTHHENTILLDQEEYEALTVVSSRKIEKKRFRIACGKHEAEIDVFEGDLEGLVLIDFEFETIEDKAAFKPPGYCLADVTQQQLILGSHLAGKSFEDIKKVLRQFNYEPLYLEL